jgi:hypothetical protein
MPEIIKFDYKKAASGDFSEVKQAITESFQDKAKSGNILYAIDAAATNPTFMEEFQQGFSRDWGKEVKFSVLNEDQMKVQFDVVQGSITPTIATTILPSMEALVRSSEILKRINIVTRNNNSFIQMFDFDAEQNAAVLTEVAAGSDRDEVLRTGDRLIPNQKVQASMKMSNWSIKSLDGLTLGKYMSRLTRSVVQALCVAVLANGSAAANGTPRGDNIRGILNNYGINGVGDASNLIGAIAYSTKAATDAAIVAAGGVASSDAYDLAVKSKAFLLPSNLSDIEEEKYVFIGSRNTWAQLRTVKDGNGRYLASSAINPLTGKTERRIDDAEFLMVPANQVPTGRLYIVPLELYTLVLDGDIINLNDGGLVQLKENLVQFVSRVHAAGSMEYGQKFTAATSVTVGSTVPNNAEQNAFRVVNTI